MEIQRRRKRNMKWKLGKCRGSGFRACKVWYETLVFLELWLQGDIDHELAKLSVFLPNFRGQLFPQDCARLGLIDDQSR